VSLPALAAKDAMPQNNLAYFEAYRFTQTGKKLMEFFEEVSS